MDDTERTLTEVAADADDQTERDMAVDADREPDYGADDETPEAVPPVDETAPAQTTPETAGAESKPRRRTRGAKNAADASAAVGRAKARARKPAAAAGRSGTTPSGKVADYIDGLRTNDEKRYATKTWRHLSGHRKTHSTPFGLAKARWQNIRQTLMDLTGKRPPTVAAKPRAAKPRAERKQRPSTKPRKAAKKAAKRKARRG